MEKQRKKGRNERRWIERQMKNGDGDRQTGIKNEERQWERIESGRNGVRCEGSRGEEKMFPHQKRILTLRYFLPR